MATQLRPLLNPLPLPPTVPTIPRRFTVRAGPRSNRGPLVKGRVLSSEAIQAVQSLKRSQRTPNPHNPSPSLTLSRLLKADLLAVLRELLRQGHCHLALQVLSTIRAEHNPDLGLYADVVGALAKAGMTEDIDRLIEEMEVIDLGDRKGLSRVIKALIGANRKEATVRFYGVMKKSGWGAGDGVEVDEYVAKVLSRGLRGFGEKDLAREVDLTLENYLNACLGRVVV